MGDVIVPSKFSICYNEEVAGDLSKKVIVPSKFSICYNKSYIFS